MKTWELGISTNFAIKRWPNPEDWARIVKQELGLSWVQFSFDQFDPRSRPDSMRAYAYRIRNACDKYGLRIHSTFTGLSIYSHNLLMHPLPEGRADGEDWFMHAFAMTQALGADAIGGPYGGLDLPSFQSETDRDAVLKSAEEALVRLLEAAPQFGIRTFLWEQTPIRREGPVDIEGTIAHLKHVNAIRPSGSASFALCLDVGHAISPDASGIDKNPYRWLEKLAPLAPVIHLQQTDGRYDRHWPFTQANNAAGIIDGDRVLASIRKSGANQPLLCIEVGFAFEEDDGVVLRDLQETVAYWQQALARDEKAQGGGYP
jgi:hypothetical protein